MEPSFEKLLVLLAEAGVRFIVVGGVAVTLQGYVRLTEDVDLLLDSKAHLIGWKERSVREKDHFDAMALRQLSANPRAFD